MKGFFEFFFENKLKVYGTLVLVPLLVYYKSLFYSFSPMDEQWLIVNDASYLQKWDNIYGIFKDTIQKVYYRPLLIATFFIDFKIAGLNPFAYHLSNLAFHIISVLLVFRLLVILTANRPTSFFLSLLFAVHPMFLHAVAWIPGRNDVLLCIFTCSSLLFLTQFIRSDKMKDAVLHLLFFLGALFIKESAAVLPLIYLFLYLTLKPSSNKVKLPALLLFWLASVLLWYYMRSKAIDSFPFAAADVLPAIKKFIYSLIIQTGKIWVPFSLSVFPTLKNSYLLLNLAIVILLAAATWKLGIKDRKTALFGLLLFFIMLALPSWYGSLTTLNEQYEHRVYTATVGMLVFVSQLNFKQESKLFKIVMLVLCFVFAARTFIRMDVYKSELSFLEEGVKDSPENYFFLSQTGNFLLIKKEYNSALPYLNKAIALQPEKAQLYNSRATAYVELNKKEEAIADYTKALALSGNNSTVYLSRCIAFKKFNDPENALKDLRAIQRLYPGMVNPELEKEINEAWLQKRIQQLNTLIRKEPVNAALYVSRAKLYFDLRMGPEALADLKKACELEPGNKEYKGHYDLLYSSFNRAQQKTQKK